MLWHNDILSFQDNLPNIPDPCDRGWGPDIAINRKTGMISITTDKSEPYNFHIGDHNYELLKNIMGAISSRSH